MFFDHDLKIDKWHATKNNLQSQKRRHNQQQKTLSTKQNLVSIVISPRLETQIIKKCQISSSSNNYDMSTTKTNIRIHVIILAQNVLSHAHNVLDKNCYCGHFNCVKLHVHMQITHVGKEKETFWISQNALSRSLSTRVWMFRKMWFLKKMWDHQFTLSWQIFCLSRMKNNHNDAWKGASMCEKNSAWYPQKALSTTKKK